MQHRLTLNMLGRQGGSWNFEPSASTSQGLGLAICATILLYVGQVLDQLSYSLSLSKLNPTLDLTSVNLAWIEKETLFGESTLLPFIASHLEHTANGKCEILFTDEERPPGKKWGRVP